MTNRTTENCTKSKGHRAKVEELVKDTERKVWEETFKDMRML